MKPLERKGLLGHECRLTYRPRTTGTERSESGLPRNWEVIDIAVLDNRKECDEVALADTVGATGRGGVAGNRPIGMRYESGVVGKHPIGMPGVARCKHGACGQIRSLQKLQRRNLVKLIFAVRHLLGLGSIEKDCTYEQWRCYTLLAATQLNY